LSNAYTVVVGGGGVGARKSDDGLPDSTNGSNSSVFGLTAIGGGKGYSGVSDTYPAGSSTVATSGGSGGGGGGYTPNATPVFSLGGAGTVGQGNKGGDGVDTATWGGGGGGGAGAAGDNQGTTEPNGSGTAQPRRGGAGLDLSSTFTTTVGESGWFAGGGGGGVTSSGFSEGGQGGGGNGADGQTFQAQNGLPNTGGGGGGGGYWQNGPGGGDGGTGIVIIRYRI
jgi:hypothetical protein